MRVRASRPVLEQRRQEPVRQPKKFRTSTLESHEITDKMLNAPQKAKKNKLSLAKIQHPNGSGPDTSGILSFGLSDGSLCRKTGENIAGGVFHVNVEMLMDAEI